MNGCLLVMESSACRLAFQSDRGGLPRPIIYSCIMHGVLASAMSRTGPACGSWPRGASVSGVRDYNPLSPYLHAADLRERCRRDAACLPNHVFQPARIMSSIAKTMVSTAGAVVGRCPSPGCCST